MAADTARDGTADTPPAGGSKGTTGGSARPAGPAEGAAAAGHGGSCACPACPHGVRESRRRALAEFRRRRDELAAGTGVPAALAHSPGASRQWVSDELAQAAQALADRTRAEGDLWLGGLWRRTVAAVWGAVAVLLAGQALTAASGAGWTAARTAGLLAALVAAGLLSAAARLHRARGGVLAPVVGEDNRLSTSRTVAAAWVLLVCYAVLVLALELAFASGAEERRRLLAGLDLQRGAGLLTVLALSCAVAVVVRRTVALRVRAQRLQKVRADRPRAADLLTDDSGRGAFTDVQYVLVSSVAVVFAAVRLGRRPDQLPDLPWGLALLVVVSALTYLAGKYAEGGRPVILSVVRSREAGDLDAPIRTGDDIEIRGSGFVPPGAEGPDRLARTTVRMGAVHVHVPLVPVAGGFANPTDTVLVVPVPVDVEPGRVEVQVITAAGVETGRYPIDVLD
ncbi:membrane protein [Streptomyces glaucosporus]|uniref:Membrane protein n=1 Tax=Streptomyces glaucosporus TaxID=284044 RepID=A0ABN3IVX4_9ACTN